MLVAPLSNVIAEYLALLVRLSSHVTPVHCEEFNVSHVQPRRPNCDEAARAGPHGAGTRCENYPSVFVNLSKHSGNEEVAKLPFLGLDHLHMCSMGSGPDAVLSFSFSSGTRPAAVR